VAVAAQNEAVRAEIQNRMDAPVAEKTRPGPAGVPTRVLVGLYVIDIPRVDDAAHTYMVDFVLSLQWKDPRLADKSQGIPRVHRKLGFDDVWNPQPRLINQRQLEMLLPQVVEVDPGGTVTYRQRIDATLSSRVNLRDFPFDRHVLAIEIVSVNYGPEEVLFVVDESMMGQVDEPTIADWWVGPGTAVVDTKYIPALDRKFSRFAYEFEVKRYSGYYFWKMIVPLSIIIVMSWTVFWIDPSQFGPQTGISITAMLTLIVYMHRVGDLLPRVPYLTRADEFIIGSLFLVFLAFLEAVATGALAAQGKGALARRLDRWARWVSPASFAGLCVFVFFR
jgi:hypothetical protein